MKNKPEPSTTNSRDVSNVKFSAAKRKAYMARKERELRRKGIIK